MVATKKESVRGHDGIPYGIYRFAGGLGSYFLFMFNTFKFVVEGGSVTTHFVVSRTVFILKSSTVENNGVTVRSLDALRSLTQCNCDSKIIKTANCFGLHRYSNRCIHKAQRCKSCRQMTDNIFEVETTAVAHFACATLTDFACAYPCVNRSWIFHVLEKAELPGFVQQFLRMIHNNGVTDFEFVGKTRGQFLMARGVRQGCLASGFFVCNDVSALSSDRFIV